MFDLLPFLSLTACALPSKDELGKVKILTIFLYFFPKCSNRLESRARVTMASLIGERCEAEESWEGKELGKRKTGKKLANHIRSPTMAKAI